MGRRRAEISQDENEMDQNIENDGMPRLEPMSLERKKQAFREQLNQNSANRLEVIGGDPDYDYYWHPVAVYNEEIPRALSIAAKNFWEVVYDDELPLMSGNHLRKFKGQRPQPIEDGNLILHKRHKELSEEFKKKEEQEIYSTRKGLMRYTKNNPETPGLRGIRYQ